MKDKVFYKNSTIRCFSKKTQKTQFKGRREEERERQNIPSSADRFRETEEAFLQLHCVIASYS